MELIYIYINPGSPLKLWPKESSLEKDPCKRFITCLLGLSLSRLGLPGFTFPEWNFPGSPTTIFL